MFEQTKDSGKMRRSPIVAVLLSLLVPGLGHLYNGQPKRALMFFVLGLLPITALSLIVQFIPSYQGVLFFMFGALCFTPIYVFIIIDAFLSARRIGAVELQRYNRWYVYVSAYLVTIIISFIVEFPVSAYSVPSSSMVPSLLGGDYVWAHTYAYRDQPLERGDVAIFKLPTDGSDYLKRIVGLPGDRIQIKGGVLHINGEAVQRERLGNYTYKDSAGMEHAVTRYQETLPNGKRHLIVEEADNYPADNTSIYTVPAGHYFAMGDNRDNSRDSRYQQDVGFIPHENLTGRIMLIYFSQNGSAGWGQFWRWPQAIRFERIGGRID